MVWDSLLNSGCSCFQFFQVYGSLARSISRNLSFGTGIRYQWGLVLKFDLEERTLEMARRNFNFINSQSFFFWKKFFICEEKLCWESFYRIKFCRWKCFKSFNKIFFLFMLSGFKSSLGLEKKSFNYWTLKVSNAEAGF